MKYIHIGKIVNTHGIKGELRLLSDFKYKDKVFKKDFIIYVGKEKIQEKITSYRPHKQFDMICLDGYNNINEVLKYKGSLVYINKEDLVLDKNKYLNEDIIGLDVVVDNKIIGQVIGIEKNLVQELLRVKKENKQYLIPYVDYFVKEIDINNNKIYINNIEGLFE